MDSIEEKFKALISERDMILQKFLAGVESKGEVSITMFGEDYSHAVRKVPKTGDFRVHDDHGGTV